eukprot:jgi/Ulvmu1/12384/UM009_0030.1
MSCAVRRVGTLCISAQNASLRPTLRCVCSSVKLLRGKPQPAGCSVTWQWCIAFRTRSTAAATRNAASSRRSAANWCPRVRCQRITAYRQCTLGRAQQASSLPPQGAALLRSPPWPQPRPPTPLPGRSLHSCVPQAVQHRMRRPNPCRAAMPPVTARMVSMMQQQPLFGFPKTRASDASRESAVTWRRGQPASRTTHITARGLMSIRRRAAVILAVGLARAVTGLLRRCSGRTCMLLWRSVHTMVNHLPGTALPAALLRLLGARARSWSQAGAPSPRCHHVRLCACWTSSVRGTHAGGRLFPSPQRCKA